VITDNGVTGNPKRGKSFFNNRQLRRRAIVGEVTAQETKLGCECTRFHLDNDTIEPGPTGRLERVEVVHRDEIKCIACRQICAAQTSRPDSERE
jgi:hypothetical protein